MSDLLSDTASVESLASYGPRLERLARRWMADDAAEDVVQETLLRAYRARDRIDPRRPLWPWLATIAVRICIDRARRDARYEFVPLGERHEGLTVVSPERVDPGDMLVRRERQLLVRQALSRMSPRHRRLLVLREVEGWSYQELLGVEGSTIDGVKCALNRARHSFRANYDAISGKGRALMLVALGRVARRVSEITGRIVGIDALPALAANFSVAVTVLVAVPLQLLAAPPDETSVPAPRPAMAASDHAPIDPVWPASTAIPSATSQRGPAPNERTPRDIVHVDRRLPDPVTGEDRDWSTHVWRSDDDQDSVVLTTVDRAFEKACATAPVGCWAPIGQ